MQTWVSNGYISRSKSHVKLIGYSIEGTNIADLGVEWVHKQVKVTCKADQVLSLHYQWRINTCNIKHYLIEEEVLVRRGTGTKYIDIYCFGNPPKKIS